MNNKLCTHWVCLSVIVDIFKALQLTFFIENILARHRRTSMRETNFVNDVVPSSVPVSHVSEPACVTLNRHTKWNAIVFNQLQHMSVVEKGQ